MAWQRRVLRRSSAGVKDCPSSSTIRSPASRTVTKHPLATFPPAPTSLSPGQRRMVCGWFVPAGETLRPVLQQHRPLRSEPPVLPVVDGHPMGVRDDQAGVRHPAHWVCISGYGGDPPNPRGKMGKGWCRVRFWRLFWKHSLHCPSNTRFGTVFFAGKDNFFFVSV